MRVLPLLSAAPLVLLGVIGFRTSPTLQAAGADPPAAVETSRLPTHFLADLGRAIFRFDTFGDEQLWTDFLRMHEPIATLSPEDRRWPLVSRSTSTRCRRRWSPR